MSRVRAVFFDPDGTRYATRRQLRAQGLCPGRQPIAAQILWRGVGGTRAAYLYRLDRARPKRAATPAVLAALDKAMPARRTCPTCRQMRLYYIPRSTGECLICQGEPTR
ncbi:RRQRL motif-containing zinc-binding protein [Couchioplanes caeruleus]|uniref:Uncharacterized protein n=2 Tax=Couchioplanes caeruleus TaxID=56438 RepID=A0A1K0FAL4_9ACTN|nr:RRQRL motif-containing zinc-binding protein [Couchioplanes caeruleus]OJF09792.1 hypothetical protein BG844_35565 [Couchioplanes caeruleus subsp. caeruleus]ROP31429.1 hypothetical protein EDD30_4330 [Couchioplanes caeruleus]